MDGIGLNPTQRTVGNGGKQQRERWPSPGTSTAADCPVPAGIPENSNTLQPELAMFRSMYVIINCQGNWGGTHERKTLEGVRGREKWNYIKTSEIKKV